MEIVNRLAGIGEAAGAVDRAAGHIIRRPVLDQHGWIQRRRVQRIDKGQAGQDRMFAGVVIINAVVRRQRRPFNDGNVKAFAIGQTVLVLDRLI